MKVWLLVEPREHGSSVVTSIHKTLEGAKRMQRSSIDGLHFRVSEFDVTE